MKLGEPKTETESSKLSVTKQPAKEACRSKVVAVKDPNKPKREDFRETFEREYPENRCISTMGRFAGEKWKSMSDSEKAPYVAIVNERKVEYEKNMKAYYKKLEEGTKEEEESGKSVVSSAV